MSVEVLDTAKEMMNQLRNSQSSRPGCPDYLFSILSGDKKRKDERAYREYQSALRRFNNHLKSLARALHLTSPVNFLHDSPFLGNYCKVPWSSN